MLSDSERFCKKFFPDVDLKNWRDWKWQLAHRLTKPEDFKPFLVLTAEETEEMQRKGAFPVAVTPYYASLLADNPEIRRTLLPSAAERVVSAGETSDPLGEEPCMVSAGLVHRYPDRVLFLVNDYCSSYCRYCTRSRLVAKHETKCMPQKKRWEKAFEYIAAHSEVRDVLVSGGDPLTLNDEAVEFLLANLRAIPHVEMIRIGSKTPVALPMRFTPQLLKIIKKYHPVYFSLHFNHPAEMTAETNKACMKIADAGIPAGSQTVLLKGVNDDAETLKKLMHALLKVRVRPYYLFQCDPIAGSSHFRVPIKKGLELIDALRGRTSGYAVPTYAVDIPGGGGKIVLAPDHFEGRDGDFVLFRNFEGSVWRYPDPE